MTSHSVQVLPHDARCRYWAKIVRAGRSLPSPCEVEGAGCIPGSYSERGDEELLPGDVMFEGEANHHRKQRGWSYWVTVVTASGELKCFGPDLGPYKTALKNQGLASELLRGAGDIAAMVRMVHGLRSGLTLDIPKS